MMVVAKQDQQPMKLGNTMSLKEHVKGNVNFVKYHDGNLWYRTDSGFDFPVPINDTGIAEFKNTDKAMMFMRWIGRHLKDIEQAKASQSNEK